MNTANYTNKNNPMEYFLAQDESRIDDLEPVDFNDEPEQPEHPLADWLFKH